MKVVFDFDGVLFDTAYEAYVVAKVAYQKTVNSDFYCDYEDFIRYRHKVTTAWNYKYVLDCISTNDKEKSSYRKLIQNSKEEDYSVFEKVFFIERSKMKEKNFSKWLSLNKPYPIIQKIINIKLNYQDVFIVSTKDKQTIIDIIKKYEGLDILENNIYGHDDYNEFKNKSAIIKEKILTKERLVFIDDVDKHFEGFGSDTPQVETILADWGYVPPGAQGSMNVKDVIELLRN